MLGRLIGGIDGRDVGRQQFLHPRLPVGELLLARDRQQGARTAFAGVEVMALHGTESTEPLLS